MCSPDEEGITVLQGRVHDWTACLRRAFPEYKDMSYAEIADRIGISRGRFFQILGLKLKPKNRIDKRISVPAEIVDALINLHDRIAAGEEEMKLEMDEVQIEGLLSTIKRLQDVAMKKLRKRLSVDEIERLAGIENSRLVNVLKPSTRESKNSRYLSTHDLQRIAALYDRIEQGQRSFTDKRGFCSGKDLNPFRLAVTGDDVRMIRWLQEHSHFTDRGLEEVLGLPNGKIAQIKAEVHRRRHKPRLDCEALLALIILVETKITEMREAYNGAALAEIEPIIPSMEVLKSAAQGEIARKHDEAA